MTDLFRLAAQAGIRVEYCRLPLNKSISTPDKEGDFVLMDYSLINGGGNERVHLAHELGHCMTGAFYNVYSPLDIRQKHENRAQRWAIKKLLPKQELHEAVKNGFYELWELAELFDLPEPFIKEAITYYKIA